MKLNNQYNKNSNTPKQATTFVCFARLRCCFFILLLSLPLFSVNKAEAGFCWAMDSAASCDVTEQNGNDYYDGEEYVLSEITGNQILTSKLPFKFRSYLACGNNNDNCGRQQFEINFNGLKGDPYDVNFISRNGNYKLDAQFNFPHENINFGRRNNWVPGNNSLGGEDQIDTNGMSDIISLTLTLKPKLLQDLQPGTHKFTVVIKGQDLKDDEVTRTLHYVFSIKIPDDKQVQITGLKPVAFGSFPLEKMSIDQGICIYANGDNKFLVKAESAKGGANFKLVSEYDDIKYKPSLKMIGRGQLQEIPITLTDLGLEGSSILGCGGEGSSNMTLDITIDETFQTLSTKPAGTYTDTLTITVSAQ